MSGKNKRQASTENNGGHTGRDEKGRFIKGHTHGFQENVSGNPGGRPKGPSVIRLYGEALEEAPVAIRAAIKEKLLKAEFLHLQMAAHYFDGKPAETHRIEGDKPLFALILLGERHDPLAPGKGLPQSPDP